MNWTVLRLEEGIEEIKDQNSKIDISETEEEEREHIEMIKEIEMVKNKASTRPEHIIIEIEIRNKEADPIKMIDKGNIDIEKIEPIKIELKDIM